MRRNLGLDQSSPPLTPYSTRHAERHQQPRRFVRDGEVQVVVLNRRDTAADSVAPPQNRLAVAEGALKTEQAARQRSERALAESQAAVHELQTKIGHANLARDEAVEATGRLRVEIARLPGGTGRRADSPGRGRAGHAEGAPRRRPPHRRPPRG